MMRAWKITVYVALKSDGTVWTWGKSSKSVQLGISAEKPAADYLSNQVPGLTKIIAIAGGFGLRVALDQNGRIWTWARDNEHGKLGDPNPQDTGGVHQAGSRRLWGDE
ncbi:MAG: hypothetical protein RBS80_01765 [Thermoguttaceae bacterium]|jgi:alpha-tubulin suppressor-like RCC1 family protein|nr:hypothetical protein [Thermoguttaceae bacterium]